MSIMVFSQRNTVSNLPLLMSYPPTQDPSYQFQQTTLYSGPQHTVITLPHPPPALHSEQTRPTLPHAEPIQTDFAATITPLELQQPEQRFTHLIERPEGSNFEQVLQSSQKKVFCFFLRHVNNKV